MKRLVKAASFKEAEDDLVHRLPAGGISYQHTRSEVPASPTSLTEAKLKVTYRQFEEYLVAEKGQSESCATLPFTLVFWITFSILAWLHGDVHNIYETRRCLTGMVEDIRIVAGAGTQQARNVSLGTLASKDDIWEWLTFGLIPSLEGTVPNASTIMRTDSGTQFSMGSGTVRIYNKLIGSVRLKQRRSATMDCKVIEDLKKFYGAAKCHSGDFSSETFGEFFMTWPTPTTTTTTNTAIPTANSTATATAAATAATNYTTTGFVDTTTTAVDTTGFVDMAYKAGGDLANGDSNTFYAWLDPRRVEDAQDRCKMLWKNRWLDQESHDLIVEAAFFNAEVKTFGLLTIKFEFRKGGLMSQEVDLRPLSANLYPAWYHYIPDALWVLWLFLLFQKEMRQLYDSCRQGSEERREYLTDPWNCLDWTSILFGFSIAVFFWFITDGIEAFKASVGGLTDLTNPMSSFIQNPVQTNYGDAVVWTERINTILDTIHELVWWKIYHRIAMFFYTLILMARFFKGFRGQPRISVISKTLALASVDLVHYYYILATVFVNFALGGYVLFGAQVEAWSTIHNSVQSAFGMTFGRVDYESLHQIAPVSAAIWFWAYIVIVVFTLFNMCISIIVGHYTEVRSSLGEVGQSIWVQGKWLAEDTYWHYSYEFRHLHRQAVSKMKPKWRRRLARFAEEVERNPIPMNAMFRAVSPNAGEYIRKSMPTLKFDRKTSGGELAMKEVTIDVLLECGCDTVTAEILLMRAKRYQSSKVDLFNPMDHLMKQLDDEMMERYQHLAEIEERVVNQTDATMEGLNFLEETSGKFLDAVKKITPAEEEPPGLPIAGSVFRELENELGQSYYYNPQTGESQWEHPLHKPNRLALAMGGPRMSTHESAFASAALQVLQKPVRPPDSAEEDPQVDSSLSAAAAPVQEDAAAPVQEDAAVPVQEDAGHSEGVPPP